MARRRLLALALALALLLASLPLPQLVRDAPWRPALPRQPLALDGLSAFFVVLALAGACLSLARGVPAPWVVALVAPLLLAYAAVPLSLTALGLGLAATVGWMLARRSDAAPEGSEWRAWLGGPIDRLPGPGWLLPPLLLLAASWLLRAGGSWRYDSPLAGAGLNAAVFVLVLAAALLGVAQLTPRAPLGPLVPLLLAPAWAYPLLRLYALGPWNNGWHLAALLLLGTLAAWSSLAALNARDSDACRGLLARSALASALLLGCLGSSAGLAAASYGLLSYLLVAAALSRPQLPGPPPRDEIRWLLTPAVPLSAPFVASWLGLAAAAASGTPTTALVIWMVGLLGGLLLALRRSLATVSAGLAALSMLAGIASPALLQLLVVPLIEQLQGGLSPFGELQIWPWLGLAMLDSGRREVATVPSLAVAGLLLVLIVIVYLLARLLGAQPVAEGTDAQTEDEAELWARLRREVFWLGGGDGEQTRGP
jgi:hypothetical protein